MNPYIFININQYTTEHCCQIDSITHSVVRFSPYFDRGDELFTVLILKHHPCVYQRSLPGWLLGTPPKTTPYIQEYKKWSEMLSPRFQLGQNARNLLNRDYNLFLTLVAMVRCHGNGLRRQGIFVFRFLNTPVDGLSKNSDIVSCTFFLPQDQLTGTVSCVKLVPQNSHGGPGWTKKMKRTDTPHKNIFLLVQS